MTTNGGQLIKRKMILPIRKTPAEPGRPGMKLGADGGTRVWREAGVTQQFDRTDTVNML